MIILFYYHSIRVVLYALVYDVNRKQHGSYSFYENYNTKSRDLYTVQLPQLWKYTIYVITFKNVVKFKVMSNNIDWDLMWKLK